MQFLWIKEFMPQESNTACRIFSLWVYCHKLSLFSDQKSSTYELLRNIHTKIRISSLNSYQGDYWKNMQLLYFCILHQSEV
jgi:hypothetical protein